MGLSSPRGPRELSHSRDIRARGYLRSDGLWDIEGELCDTKSFAIANRDRGGEIAPGEALHYMLVRLTVDADLLIHGAEAFTGFSPYAMCGDITGVYEGLVGLKIGQGFRRSLQERFGGVRGCTHISELILVIATVAFQTVYGDRNRLRRAAGEAEDNRPPSLQTCHVLALDSPIVRRDFPQNYSANPSPEKENKSPARRDKE